MSWYSLGSNLYQLSESVSGSAFCIPGKQPSMSAASAGILTKADAADKG
jgi:hypothetical protein